MIYKYKYLNNELEHIWVTHGFQCVSDFWVYRQTVRWQKQEKLTWAFSLVVLKSYETKSDQGMHELILWNKDHFFYLIG